MMLSSSSRRTVILALAGGCLLVSALVRAKRLWAFVVPPMAPAAGATPSAATPVAPRRDPGLRPASLSVPHPASAHEELGGCRPGQDISCTVIRETSAGFIVWTRTYRDGSQAAVVPAPSIAAEGKTGVCVMPTVQALPAAVYSRLPNGAPILE